MLHKPGTDYALELAIDPEAVIEPGGMVTGEIRVEAARIDTIKTGGRYIEPLAGPPRRVAGRVIEPDPHANVIVVDAGPFPVVCTPSHPQRSKDFEHGQLVTMGVRPGAVFVPV